MKVTIDSNILALMACILMESEEVKTTPMGRPRQVVAVETAKAIYREILSKDMERKK